MCKHVTADIALIRDNPYAILQNTIRIVPNESDRDGLMHGTARASRDVACITLGAQTGLRIFVSRPPTLISHRGSCRVGRSLRVMRSPLPGSTNIAVELVPERVPFMPINGRRGGLVTAPR